MRIFVLFFEGFVLSIVIDARDVRGARDAIRNLSQIVIRFAFSTCICRGSSIIIGRHSAVSEPMRWGTSNWNFVGGSTP